jgi:glycosyltransferase involved in cell wall biosynthesis
MSRGSSLQDQERCIGYLVSQYPAASHTFIRREVQQLRRLGLPLATFSVRPPSADEVTTPDDAIAFGTTTYIFPSSTGSLISRHVAGLITRPLAYFRTLRLALQHRAPGVKSLLWAVFHFGESISLAAELKRSRVCHLHNHFANSGATVGLLAATFLEIPWSLSLHGISETDYPAGLLLGDKVARASFVACVSWFGQAQAMRVSRRHHWDKFFVVRCGLQSSMLATKSQFERPRSEIPSIVCAGRLSPEKGHLGLLKALLALKSRGVAFRVVFVGDGPNRDQVEREYRASGVGRSVTFLGRLNENAALAEIAKADLLVLPSFMEGLPIVLMEAMAMGVPVVGPRVAGVPELVRDGSEGLLFTPSDWNDLADKLQTLLSDAGLCRTLARSARLKVEREFSLDTALLPLLKRLSAALGAAGDELRIKGTID